MGRTKKRLLWLLFPTLAVALCSCEGSPFSDSDFIGKVFPNGYWDFLIQLIAFIVLLLIVFFLGYKPVRNMLRKRQEAIEKMVADTKENQLKAKKASDAAQDTILAGKEEAERIIAASRRQAEEERGKMLAETNDAIAAKRKKADEDILAAQKASQEEVRRQIVDVAMLASKALLEREVDTADNQRMVADFVAEMGSETEGK